MNRPGIILAGKKAGNWYVETLNKLVESAHPSFEYQTLQIDFDPINALLPDKMKEAARLLEPYFVEFEMLAQPYILANITLHEAVQYFSFSPEYFISIDQIFRNKLLPLNGKVTVLGTKYTMNHSYIKTILPGLELITLSEKIQNLVDSLRKLYNYSEDADLARELYAELDRLDVAHLVIACTELSVAWNDISKDKRWIDLPELQCENLILSVGDFS